MQDNYIIWKNIFNTSKAHYHSIQEAANIAQRYGYALFSWNGDLYSVSHTCILTRIGSFEELGL